MRCLRTFFLPARKKGSEDSPCDNPRNITTTASGHGDGEREGESGNARVRKVRPIVFLWSELPVLRNRMEGIVQSHPA